MRRTAPPGPEAAAALAALRTWLQDTGVDADDGLRPGEVVVRLPGEHRLVTTVSVLVGAHTVSVSAFVVRHAEENAEEVMRWLLRRNTRLRGIAFALDPDDDVYLVGRLPTAAVTPAVLDDLMGAVLDTADGAFDTLLGLGFAASIRREAAWRAARGLDTANLAAFQRLVHDGDDSDDRLSDGDQNDGRGGADEVDAT
ncbi:YbjN domain-containing protein [Aquipuribacter hungaricus]|uniref:YbjN domain-containing protein n=1 Tax=Aquipuribacter hungaricus TaxID=545624 RepID=A0ABV7WBE8_9MICO